MRVELPLLACGGVAGSSAVSRRPAVSGLQASSETADTQLMDNRRMAGAAFAEVLEAARANQSWAFQRLFAELARPVAGYLRMQGKREPDDLVNEAFLGAFSSIANFEGDEDHFRSWVFTIAHRRLIDERRRLGRRPLETSDAVYEFVGGDAEDDALSSLGNARVRERLARLPDDQRDVLLLRVVADLTVERTAETLGKSVGAVKALQRRGLTALRKEISREGVPL